MSKEEMKNLKEKKVNANTFKIIKESDYVESVENIGISDGQVSVWYTVYFKDGDEINIIAPKYKV